MGGRPLRSCQSWAIENTKRKGERVKGKNEEIISAPADQEKGRSATRMTKNDEKAG